MSHTNGNLGYPGDNIVHRLTSALTLITLGLFFLANTMGIIPWGAWGTIFIIFFRIWPIFIIIGGFQVIFGKNSIASSLLGVFSSLFFVFVLLFAAYLNTSNQDLKHELERNIPIFEDIKSK